MTATIVAQPCGRSVLGEPLATRTYTICRSPENWGDGRSRIWVDGLVPTPCVVVTASIRPVDEVSRERDIS